MNPVEQKEVADKALFPYPEKRGLLQVLNISCDKALEVTQMFGHVTFILSTSNNSEGYHTLLFYLANLDINFPKVLICTTMSSFKRMRKVAKRYYQLLNFYVWLTCILIERQSIFITKLMHKVLILIHLLYSSTCFEHHYAHLQEDKLYQYSIWYRHSLTVQYTGYEKRVLL